jgi:hypothetical protein
VNFAFFAIFFADLCFRHISSIVSPSLSKQSPGLSRSSTSVTFDGNVVCCLLFVVVVVECIFLLLLSIVVLLMIC